MDRLDEITAELESLKAVVSVLDALIESPSGLAAVTTHRGYRFLAGCQGREATGS